MACKEASQKFRLGPPCICLKKRRTCILKAYVSSAFHIILKQVADGCNTANVDLLFPTKELIFVEKIYNFYNL